MTYSNEQLVELMKNKGTGRGVWDTSKIAGFMTKNLTILDAKGNTTEDTVITLFDVIVENGETIYEENEDINMSEIYKGTSYKRADYKTDNSRIQCILKSIGASLERKFKKEGMNSAHRLIEGQLCVVKNLEATNPITK